MVYGLSLLTSLTSLAVGIKCDTECCVSKNVVLAIKCFVEYCIIVVDSMIHNVLAVGLTSSYASFIYINTFVPYLTTNLQVM